MQVFFLIAGEAVPISGDIFATSVAPRLLVIHRHESDPLRKRMDQQIHISYLGLVRNVIGCREENVEAAPGTTIGELLQFLVAKHGDPFKHSVFKSGCELRSTAQVCLNDCDISELQGFATRLQSGEHVSIVIGVYPPEGG